MIAEENLLEKINTLPRRRIAEVIDFVNFLADRDSMDQRDERSRRMKVFAEQYGGSEIDLDDELEKAAVEHLLATDGADR